MTDPEYPNERAKKAWLADSYQAVAEALQDERDDCLRMTAEWTFCPECGSEEIRYREGRHKQCAGCGQEWFSDLNYVGVVAKNLRRLTAERDEARNLAERLKLEAQGHAMEARTANATIYEIYQVVSGATGEPGNWHGAEPVRERFAALSALNARQGEVLKAIVTAWRNATSGRGNPERDLGWTGSQDNWGQIFAWYAERALATENSNAG